METLDPLARFIEDLGLSVEEDGMPRIAGRMLGLLIVQDGPFLFDEIADELQVSRGSVSTNARLLEQLGMIERFTLPGERRDFFRLSQDIHGRLLEKSLRRLEQRQIVVDRCLDRLGEGHDGARGRLEEMRRFYRLASESTQRFLDSWSRGDETLDESEGELRKEQAAS